MRGTITLFFFLVYLLVFPLAVAAQEISVSGKVTDQGNGQPLPGVTIKVQGINRGGVTDGNGAFTLQVSTGASLIFSQLGMISKTVQVANASPINVSLSSEAQDLGEVVVVGYGTQKKLVTTAAISTVKASDLENMPVTRVEQSLQGRVAGVTVAATSGQPGEGATLRIRGTTSINSSDPLYIVDGVQIGGGIEFLNQSDIESINVLKDAASAAIYGAKAASGVILITTKKGLNNGKINVNYNGYLGTQQAVRKLNLLNATQYATLYNEAQLASNASAVLRFPNPSQYGVGTDWQAEVFNDNAIMHNHELSLSGGNEKSTYYSSFGYFDQDGIVATSNSQFKRFTARFNSDHQITKAIKFGNTIGYTRINSIGVGTNSEYGTPLTRAINMDPITPLLETDPAKFNAPPYSNNPVVRNHEGFPYAISPYAQSEVLNPVAALAVAQGNNWSDKVVANLYVEIKPIKGLTLRSAGGVDLAFWGGQSFSPIYYLTNTFQTTTTSYSRNINRGLFWILDHTASYETTINKHSFNALLGYSAQRNSGETQGGTKEGIPVDNLKDASLQFPVARANSDFYGGEYLNTLNSVFGRLTYDYDQKYLFNGIIRRDGSSRFGSNNKFGYFPSASVGWVASREGFFPQNDVVNLLKFRASYGVTGNDNIGNFRYLSTVSGGRNYTLGNSAGLTNGVSPDALSNPDLKWEETSSTDIGIDATLFNKLSITADWYTKKTTGMLLDVAVPLYVGNNGPVGNIADLTNQGIELELGYSDNIGEFSYKISANGALLKNRIGYLGDDKEYLGGQTITPAGLEVTRTGVGHAIGSFYGFRSDGLFQTQQQINDYKNADGNPIQPEARPGDIKFRDLNGDGLINDSDREFIGDPTPKFTYGMTFSAAYKGFDILVFGQGSAGNQIFNGLRRFDLPSSNYTTDILNRWTGEGTSNTTPRLAMEDNNKNYSRVSSLFLESGSYFRIKTVQLGYSLPNNVVKKAGLSKLRLYVMANNLFTFTEYGGYDPEIGGGSYGIDRGFYPQARTLFLGLNVGF